MGYAKRFRFRNASYKRGSSPIEPPPQLVLDWLRIEPDWFKGERAAPFRKAARNHNRMMSWAIGKSKNELIDAMGRLAWELTYARSNRSEASEVIDEVRGRMRELRRALDAKLKVPSKGGKAKDEKSPFPAARAEMKRLWTIGFHQGWLAPMYLSQLKVRGHNVKLRTVNDWLKTLREGRDLP